MLDQDATEGQMIWDDSQVGYRFHGRTGQMNCLFLSGQEEKKQKQKSCWIQQNCFRHIS